MNPINIFVGCDVGDRTTEVCVLDGRGVVLERVRIRTTRPAVTAWFSKTARARVILEVGAHSRWISAALAGLGHEVVVANPRQTKLISASRRKTDRRDAELLARLGRFDPHLLGPVRHRSDETHADLALVRARDVLVRERTRLINYVRGILKPFGVRIPGAYAEAFAKRAAEVIPSNLLGAVEPVLATLAAVNDQILATEKRIQQRTRVAYPDAAWLAAQIRGVGPITSLTFVLTIEDPSRFKKSRDVAAFVGLVPRRFQSSDHDPELRITKSGDALTRRLLVACAQYILLRGEDSDLRRWGLALAAHGRKNAKKRAIVAVARKLAVLLHRLWVTHEPYVPLGYTQRPLAA